MNHENPFQPSTIPPRSISTHLSPSNRAMWIAYLIAPMVTPLTFVAIVLCAGFIALTFGGDVNEASMLVLPFLALTVGMVSCYFVAGVVGMPIAFYLRRVKALNAYSIHGAALCWGAFFTTICAIYLVGGSWSDLPLALCYVGVGVIPSVMLSGTAFWFLLRYFTKPR